MDSKEKKKCFIITPIGNEGSEIRKKADGIIDAVIEPVLNDLDFDILIPHKMNNPGSITTQIIDQILNDDLVVANLTGLNPNVMYELAVRHAVRKPIVCVVENSTKLPFDIITDRVIFYDDNMFSVSSTKHELTKMIDEAMNQNVIDNPIYRSMKDKRMLETIDNSKDETATAAYKYLIERFDKIERYFLTNPQKVTQYVDSVIVSHSVSVASISFERLDPSVRKHEILQFVRNKYADIGIEVETTYVRSVSHRDMIRIKNGNVSDILKSLVSELSEKFGLKDVQYQITNY